MSKPSRIFCVFYSVMLLSAMAYANAAWLKSDIVQAPRPHWGVTGGKADAWFGFSSAAAGDINGDGFGDLIVGAYRYDNGEAIDAGRVFLYMGSSNGLSDASEWTIAGSGAGANMGISVACAGDLNGDGFDDVVIGASGYSESHAQAGRALVFFGSASGLASEPDWVFDGDRPGALLGCSVAGVGDVNADGYCDLLVGARGHDAAGQSAGRVYFFLGSKTGLSQTPAWIADGQEQGGCFGAALAAAGDVNADGFADFAIGAPFQNLAGKQGGCVYVYCGSAAGPGALGSWTGHCGVANAQFGAALAAAGDFNSDGFADLAVGAPGYSGNYNGNGRVFVYFGAGNGLAESPGWFLEGSQANARLGCSVACAGDANGDGIADLLVGASGWTDAFHGEGAAFLFHGARAVPSTTPTWTVCAAQPEAALGSCVASAGDVNGDGYADLLIGSCLFTQSAQCEGAVFVYFGAADAPGSNPAWSVAGAQTDARFGFAVADAGDVNADGYSDVLVSAYMYDAGRPAEGRVYAFYGTSNGLASESNWLMNGNQSGGYFGRSIACAGDVNGDGYGDVIIGASAYDRGQTDEGAAFIFLGGPNGLSSRPFWIGEANQANAGYGFSVACAGDVNGDGFSDVIVGAYKFDAGQTDEGRAYLYLGGKIMSTNAAWTFESDQAGAYLGNSVACAGDVNGDGFSDVIVGAYKFDATASDQGRVFLFMGGTNGLSTTPAWTCDGEAESDFFGWPVACAGDVNGDGFSDIIIGAWGANLNAGKVYVYYGSTSGPAPAAWSAAGWDVDDYLGAAAACAGDVNGDGFSDVIITGYGFDANGLSNVGRAQIFYGSAAGLFPNPAWSVDGAQAAEMLGRAVACAGDVNGDGFADVLIGAVGKDNKGCVSIYYGAGAGLSMWPRALQVRRNTAIPLLGLTDEPRALRICLDAQTPYGRSRAALEWKATPIGNLSANEIAGTSAFFDVAGRVRVTETLRGLTPGALYSWRCRLLYAPDQPWAPRTGRWLTGYGKSFSEPAFRASIRAVPGDYDGDGASDQALYDIATGAWFIKSAQGRVLAWNLAWGGPTMLPACGDYDGDGIWDIGVYQLSSGAWFVLSLTGKLLVAGSKWGGPGMMPVPGDYNGDGVCDFGAYEIASGGWYVKSGLGPVLTWNLPLGAAGFSLVPGDYDGDRAVEPAVFDGSTGAWYARGIAGNVLFWGALWGGMEMTPVLGDYDGDGKWDLAVYHQAAGLWYIRASSSNQPVLWAEEWGGPGFSAVAGDYDGDGIWDLAVYTPGIGSWFVRTVQGTVLLWADAWGGEAYTPVGAVAF